MIAINRLHVREEEVISGHSVDQNLEVARGDKILLARVNLLHALVEVCVVARAYLNANVVHFILPLVERVPARVGPNRVVAQSCEAVCVDKGAE